MHQDQIVRPRNLPTIVGISRTSIWRLECAGKFPKRIKLSQGAVGWRMSDVLAWIESREVIAGEVR